MRFLLSLFLLITFESFAQEMILPEVIYNRKSWKFLNNKCGEQGPDCICSKDSIQKTVDMLNDFPNVVIKIYSHTDFHGSGNKNQILSENRSRAYYTALVDLGIDPRRIIPEGRGEIEPRKWVDESGKEVMLTEDYINSFKKTDSKKYEYLNQINRRTTAVIISQDFNPETDPQTKEEAKKKNNYNSYLKY